MGKCVFFDQSAKQTFEYVKASLEEKLGNIDASKIRGEYKLNVYKSYLLPSLRFILTVHDIAKSNLEELDDISTRCLKRWSGLARSAPTAALHSLYTCNISTISELFETCHTLNVFNLVRKGDEDIQTVLQIKRSRESSKTRTSVFLEAYKLAECEPSQSIIKERVRAKQQQDRLQHIKGLIFQGKYLEFLHEQEEDAVWKSFVFGLPIHTLKFLLNSIVETLPTRSNLSRWGKVTSDKCVICNMGIETTMHIPNGCGRSLRQGRYTWRHNCIINFVAGEIDTAKYIEYADVAKYQTAAGGTIPPDILVTPEKPDIVIINKERTRVEIFELTCPFEHRIEVAENEKPRKYEPLVNEISKVTNVKFHTLEIGSRGMLTKKNRQVLRKIYQMTTKRVTEKTFVANVTTLCISASYYLFIARKNIDWLDPVYLKPTFKKK